MKQYKLIPEWEVPKGIVLVYPKSVLINTLPIEESRAILTSFYDTLIEFIEEQFPIVDIKVIVQESDFELINHFNQLPFKNVSAKAIKCDDIWVRDWGPIPIKDNKTPTGIKLKYNPNYHYGAVPYTDDMAGRILQSDLYGTLINDELNFDGGNIVTNGKDAIICDSVFRNNPYIPKREIADKIQYLFSLRHLMILPVLLDEEIGHADGIVRFLNEKMVLVGSYSRKDGEVYYRYSEEIANKVAEKFEVFQIPMYTTNEKMGNSKIGVADGCYINFLRVGMSLVIPQFDYKMDEEVISMLKLVCGNLINVIPYPDKEGTYLLSKFGGIFNCITNLYY